MVLLCFQNPSNSIPNAFGNPILLADPSGKQSECKPLDIQCQSLEWLREQAEACYNSSPRDLDCVERAYYALAIGGRVTGFKHASDHLFRFLRKEGDILYHPDKLDGAPDTSWWVKMSPSVGPRVLALNSDLVLEIHSMARAGKFAGFIEVDPRKVNPDIEDEKDLYLSMNEFSLWAEADYEISGCYEVTMIPTYRFWDPYDWHEGLAAGGAVQGLAGFKDEWAAKHYMMLAWLLNMRSQATGRAENISTSTHLIGLSSRYRQNQLTLECLTDKKEGINENQLHWINSIPSIAPVT